jgi:hypothetical protein
MGAVGDDENDKIAWPPTYRIVTLGKPRTGGANTRKSGRRVDPAVARP